MRNIVERFPITQCDFDELNSEHSRWTMSEFAYWFAKLKTMYPAEGYGLYNPHTESDESGKTYIVWEHSDSCD